MLSKDKSEEIRSIAVMMMLFLHLFNRSYEGLFEPLIFVGSLPLSYYLSLFSDACVPILCYLSGYGLYSSYAANRISYGRKCIRRLALLYVNYWIVLVIFVIVLSCLMNEDGFPGTVQVVLLNMAGISSSYNGAWWFLLTYVFLVSTSVLLFSTFNQYALYWLVGSFVLYFVAFYYRVYQFNPFGVSILDWVVRQLALYGTSLFPFLVGAITMKNKWDVKLFIRFRHKSAICGGGVVGLVILHGLIPNFAMAPFIAIPFVFLYIQFDVPNKIGFMLRKLSVHATNMWLIHFFFLTGSFSDFVYSFTYVIPIYTILFVLTLVSSLFVNQIKNRIFRWV